MNMNKRIMLVNVKETTHVKHLPLFSYCYYYLLQSRFYNINYENHKNCMR